MTFIEKINSDFKKAMKESDKIALEAIRSIKTSLKNAEIKKGKQLTEDDITSVIFSESKKRKESIEEFKKANRQDLIESEQKELEIIEKYLPKQLSEEEIEEIINSVFETANPTSIKEIGKIMGPVMQKVKGKADGRIVKQLVNKRFESIE